MSEVVLPVEVTLVQSSRFDASLVCNVEEAEIFEKDGKATLLHSCVSLL